jgi:hypothetical protein
MIPNQERAGSKNRVGRVSRARSDAHAKARPRSAGAPVREPEPPAAPRVRRGVDILVTDSPIRRPSLPLPPRPGQPSDWRYGRPG